MAEKLLLIWISENRGADGLLLMDVLPLPEGPDGALPVQLQQAASTRATVPAHPIRPPLLVIARNGSPHYEGRI
jgi:hypothetical protein